MKHAFQNLGLALLSLIFIPVQLIAQLYEIPFDEKIRNSTLIVEGKVAESESYRAANGDIYTAHKIVVVGILKGSFREHDLTVTTWGGTVGDETQTWSHLLTLEKGDYGIFFLEPTQAPETENWQFAKPCFDVYASQQGFLRFVQNDLGVWTAREPFHTYSDLKKDVYQEIASATGQQPEVLNAAESSIRSGVRYAFKDVTFDGSKFTFNIYANSLIDNKKLYQSGIIMGYNPDFFGDSIATNGNLELQTAGISSNVSTYSLSKTDLAANKVQIQLQTVGSVSGLTTLTTSEQLLASGSLTIENIFADPGLFYDIDQMLALNKFYNTDAGGFAQVFDTVVVDTDFPFELYAPEIDSIRPLSLRAGTDDILTIYGKNFGDTQGSSYVEFTNAYAGISSGVDWIEPLTTDYIWSDTKIEVFVPSVAKGGNYDEYAGSGKIRVRVSGSTKTSTESIKVRLAADNRALTDAGNPNLKRKKVRLIGDFGEDSGYTLYYNQNFKNLNGAVPAFERALCTWVQSSNINFRVKEYDEIDTTYQPFACQILLTNSLPAGTPSTTKAITDKSYYLGCQDASGNVIKGSLKKFDIYFRQSANWYLNEQYDPTLPFSYWENNHDLESFALHELGHAQLLLHVNQADEVMYYEVVTPKRVLQTGDVEGGNYIKGISVVAEPDCDVSPIVPNGDCGLIPTIDVGSKETIVKFRPNPATNWIFFEGPEQIQKLQVFTSLGELVVELTPNTSFSAVDISKLNAGFYFALVKTNNKYHALKFEKI
ncbi:MAG: hypothetical protein PGMFKBFP_02640 [Anaerolineales bacterium]|nr:hypothetical protein [Anaerolineales bacterium]